MTRRDHDTDECVRVAMHFCSTSIGEVAEHAEPTERLIVNGLARIHGLYPLNARGPTVNLEYFKSKDPNVKCPRLICERSEQGYVRVATKFLSDTIL